MKPFTHLFVKALCFSFITLIFNSKALASSCCGGGFALPSLITGDERAQLTASLTQGQIDTDVFSSGVWKRRPFQEQIQTLRIAGAHILYDRWQVGASLPVVHRQREGQSSSGPGDLALSSGYEFLPDWDYHPWRPKGVGFLSLTLPTGQSVFESDHLYDLDVRGRGFWALGLGAIFTKTLGAFDAYASLDVHRSFQKNASTSTFNGTLKPGYGGLLSVGGGYNRKALRLGASIVWAYEDPIRATGSITTEGSAQRFATTNFMVNYLWNRSWATTITYSDQTLFGTPLNTSLSKTFSFALQKRWAR